MRDAEHAGPDRSLTSRLLPWVIGLLAVALVLGPFMAGSGEGPGNETEEAEASTEGDEAPVAGDRPATPDSTDAQAPPRSPPAGSGRDTRPQAPPPRAENVKFLGAGPVNVEWTSSLGKGGARVPSSRAGLKPRPAFSKLRGVVFGPAGEIHFVGVREKGKPLLRYEDLLDAFVLAYRGAVAGSHPLGVTIEPTPAQAEGKLDDRDLMPVRYLGDASRTVVGRDSLRGDLDLKNLGSGVDNLNRKPIACAVPGHLGVLDRRAMLLVVDSAAWAVAGPRLTLADGCLAGWLAGAPLAGSGKVSWHRFWLAPRQNLVRQSKDGRAFLLETQLHAQTEYMVPRGGKLVPGNAPPSPAAEGFVRHVNAHFDEYAGPCPVFSTLTAYAQLASLAEAVRPPRQPDGRARPELDTAWLLDGHRPQEVETPAATPALVVKRPLPVGGRALILLQTGGVNLGPRGWFRLTDRSLGTLRAERVPDEVLDKLAALKNRKLDQAAFDEAVAGALDRDEYARFGELVRNRAEVEKNDYRVGDRDAEALSEAVLAEAKRRPDQPNWTVRIGPTEHEVLTHVPLSAAVPQVWQTDLVVGEVALVRDYPAGAGATSLGGWELRLPRMSFSRATVQLEGQKGRLPRAVHVQDRPGAVVTLDRISQVTLPGQPQTLAYASRDGKRRLLVYRNQVVYLDGEVKWLGRPGEKPVMHIPPGTRVVHFSGTAPHQVERVLTAKSRLQYRYGDGRLAAIQDGAGNEVRLVHDDKGRLIALADGKERRLVEYRRGPDGRLRAVVNRDGQAISYAHDRLSGELLWACADPPAGSRDAPRASGRFGYFLAPTRDEVREAGKELGGEARAGGVHEAPAGSDRPLCLIDLDDGNKVEVDLAQLDKLVGQLTDPLAAANRSKQREDLRGLLNRAVKGDAILLFGHHVAHEVAPACAQLDLPKFIAHGIDRKLALENFKWPTRFTRPTRSATEWAEMKTDDRGPWLKRGNVLVHKDGIGLLREVTGVLGKLGEPDQPDVVVIVGHHNESFQQACRDLPAEMLRGKTLIFLACNTQHSDALAGEMLYQRGAIGVSYLGGQVKQELLPAVLEQLHRELAKEKGNANPHIAAQRALRGTVKELLEKAAEGVFPEEVKKLLGDRTPQQKKLEKFREMLAPLAPQLRLSRALPPRGRTCRARAA